MSEEDTKKSSGIVPGDPQAVRRPTAMPSGSPPQRMVTKPTVMAGASKPAAKRPTAMPVQPASPTVSKAQPAPGGPTAMRGTKRSRISVTSAELWKDNPGIDPAIFERVLEVVGRFSPDTATDRDAILWGSELQQSYSTLVTRSLKLGQSVVLSSTSTNIERMMTILGSIKVEKIFGKRTEGFLSRVLAKASDEIDSPQELENAQREIEQLIGLTQASIDPLVALKVEAENLSAEIEKVKVEAEVLSIAALSIAKYFMSKPSQVGLAQRFTERGMSLTATHAQIQSTGPIRAAQIEQPLQLISVVQNVVLVTLPGLVGNIAALQTMMKSPNKPTVTHISELGSLIKQTTESLKV